MIKLQRNRGNRRNNKIRGHKTAPQMQLSKNINLLSKSTSAWVNISLPLFVYAYDPSDLYSFSGSSDVRSYAFSTITAATEFTNFATVYNDYRLHSVSFNVTPMSNSSVALPSLVCGIDPEASSGNPTNATFILSDHTRLISPVANGHRSVNFRFPGVGMSSNIWLPVTTAPSGSFYIGNNTATGLFSSTILAYDAMLSLLIEFNNIK